MRTVIAQCRRRATWYHGRHSLSSKDYDSKDYDTKNYDRKNSDVYLFPRVGHIVPTQGRHD